MILMLDKTLFRSIIYVYFDKCLFQVLANNIPVRTVQVYTVMAGVVVLSSACVSSITIWKYVHFTSAPLTTYYRINRRDGKLSLRCLDYNYRLVRNDGIKSIHKFLVKHSWSKIVSIIHNSYYTPCRSTESIPVFSLPFTPSIEHFCPVFNLPRHLLRTVKRKFCLVLNSLPDDW